MLRHIKSKVSCPIILIFRTTSGHDLPPYVPNFHNILVNDDISRFLNFVRIFFPNYRLARSISASNVASVNG